MTHGRSTVVVRAQIATTVVNPLPATVGMAVISPYEDQGGTRNAAELRSRSLLVEGRQVRLCPAQSRNFTMYDGSEMVRTKDRVTLSVKPEPPRPLTRELAPADPFPIDALGPLLRDAVQAIHDKLQAPLAIGGQSVLGTATLAVQGHADVQLPTGKRDLFRVFSSLLRNPANARAAVTLKPCGPSDTERRSCANSTTRTFPTIKTRKEPGSVRATIQRRASRGIGQPSNSHWINWARCPRRPSSLS